jgi:predicted nucleotidyltransferase
MMKVGNEDEIIRATLKFYPDVQAIYLFGSYGTEDERQDSDADIALLLPPELAKNTKNLIISPLHDELEALLKKKVDLLNLRYISTVFKKEVVMTGRCIYTGDWYAVEEFEMLTISFYQKLNQERAEVLAEGLRSGKFYDI